MTSGRLGFSTVGFTQVEDLLDHLARLGQSFKLPSEVCYNCLSVSPRGGNLHLSTVQSPGSKWNDKGLALSVSLVHVREIKQR